MLIVPQQGRHRFVTELGVLDVEPQEIAVIPRGMRFRVELPDGSGARLRLRELRRALPPARPRPDRLERPGQPARLPDAGRRLRGRRRRRTSWSRSSWASCGRRGSTTRRSTSSPGTATTRRTSTTCAASTRSARSASTTPTRRSSLVLHLAVRHAGRRQHRLRDLPAAHGWSMQDTFRPPWFHRNVDERVHGPGARRLRRQGRRLRARRREPAQLHDAATAPTPRPSRRRAAPTCRSRDVIERHDGLHVRDPLRLRPTAAGASSRRSCSTSTTAAGKACRSTSIRASHEHHRRHARPGAAELGRVGQRPGDATSRSRTCRSAASAATERRRAWRIGVAIGDQVLDLRARRPDRHRRHEPADAPAAARRARRCARRSREGLRDGSAARGAFRARPACRSRTSRWACPAEIGDYTDFYTGIHHATDGRQAVPARQPAAAELQVGADRLPRPRLVDRRRAAQPFRAAARADARRPTRQRPSSRPSRAARLRARARLLHRPAATRSASRSRSTSAEEHVFGVALLNDWSARDIQAWEYQPLGPVPVEELRHHDLAVDRDAGSARAVPRRRSRGPTATRSRCPTSTRAANRERGAIDIELEVWLQTAAMREAGPCRRPADAARTSATRYWTLGAAGRAPHGQRLQPAQPATCSAPARCRARRRSRPARCSS